MLALGTAQVRSRQDGIRLLGAVTAMEALSLEAAGDVRLAGDLAAGASLDARSAAGSVVFERRLGVAGGAASFSVGGDLVFLGDALFYGPLSATRVGRTLDSRSRLQVGGDLLLDIAGDFVSEGLLQSTGSVRIQARNITTNARPGGIVANGDIELVVRDLGQLGALGSVSSSGGSVLLSGSRFSNAGDVIAGGAGLVFSGGTLSNAGQIAAETVRVTGALDNHGRSTARRSASADIPPTGAPSPVLPCPSMVGWVTRVSLPAAP
jgi:hypothetical protein